MTNAAPATQAAAPAEHMGSAELEALLKKPLRMWGDQERIDYVRREPDRAAKLLRALLESNTAELPDTVFAQREGGVVQKVLVAVTLRESEGHINTVGGGNFMVAAAGYRRLNQVAGIQVIAPDSISVEDKRQPNPYVQLDPKSRTPCAVYCRKIAIGPSPLTGALVATDVMLRFDLNLYLLEALIAKVKDASNSDTGQPDAIGIVGTEEQKPEGQGNWLFIKMSDIGGGVGWWFNLRAHQVRLALQEHVTRMKFAERVAQTMAERNALKAHPAMPAVIKVDNKLTVVRMIGWRKDFDPDDLKRIRELAQEGKLHEVVETVVPVNMDNSDLDDVDRQEGEQTVAEQQAEEARQRGEGQAGQTDPGEDQRPADERAPAADQVGAALKAKQRLVDTKGPKAARDLLRSLGIDRVEEATADQVTKFIAAVKEASK